MTKKRTCAGCRCWENRYPYCHLGYEVKCVTYSGIVVGGIPQEPCPKPTTVDQWLDAEPKPKE